jgi:hypothetical protein
MAVVAAAGAVFYMSSRRAVLGQSDQFSPVRPP